ncbi:hypothetical protein Mag101_08670 [Microbulbifer agarilyticus]|uniref:DUF7931 domain-containing protein n=1 Tax=Microbulbifer agarilyticus TaxID=260552 RepID=A0A1Q2M4Q4_9GAMM|nr:hypothetical protein [Microbulbifer agarilyticus]AQQ67703.1 hypothetical protein Mag101_08670 [Microbulbifer agarilyticus]
MTGTDDPHKLQQAEGSSGENPHLTFEGGEQCADALKQLIGTSRRRLRIFSQHLARQIYGDLAVVDALSEFARSSRYAQVEILITDSEPLLRQPHRLLPLLKRLQSRITLRKIQPSSEPTDWEFAIADQRLSLSVSDHLKWNGQYRSDDPVRNVKLNDVFEQHWLAARPDPALRQFVL